VRDLTVLETAGEGRCRTWSFHGGSGENASRMKQIYFTGLLRSGRIRWEIDKRRMDEVISDLAGTARVYNAATEGAGFLGGTDLDS